MDNKRKGIIIMRRTMAVLTVLLGLLFAFPVKAKTMYTIDTVRMRTGPGKSYDIIDTLGPDTEVEVYDKDGDWADAEYDGKEGYICLDYLTSSAEKARKAAKKIAREAKKKGKKSSAKSSGKKKSSKKKSAKKKSSTQAIPRGTAKINASDVNIRKKPKGQVIGQLDKGDKVKVYKSKGDWTKVQTGGGTWGYVYTSYIGSMVSRTDQILKWKDKAVEFCEDNLDAKYSQEKRNSEGYFDCSSLMRDAFIEACGLNIGETTYTQTENMADYLYKIDTIYDASYGDILYHLSGEDENHCGIYLGNGRVLNASQTAGKVKIKEYDGDSTYWEYGCKAAAYCYDEKNK